MADEFPSSLQQFAVPRAGDNKAGQKSQTPKAVPAGKKKPAQKTVVTAAKQALTRMQSRAPDLHQAIDQASAGLIKHGKESPYATGEVIPESSEAGIVPSGDFDPFESSPATGGLGKKLDPIAIQARKNALLNELGALDDGLQNQNLTEDQVRSVESLDEEIPIHLPKSDAQRAREALDIVRRAKSEPEYLSKTTRVMMELTDGTFTIPVTDVKESRLSMLLLLPLHENATIFIPKPGTQLFLTHNNRTTKVYYPGTYVEVPELRTGFMSLIKAEAEAETEVKA